MLLLPAAVVHGRMSAAHAARRRRETAVLRVVLRVFVPEKAATRASADPYGGGVGVHIRRVQFAGERLEYCAGVCGRGGGRGHTGSAGSDWSVPVVRAGGGDARPAALPLSRSGPGVHGLLLLLLRRVSAGSLIVLHVLVFLHQRHGCLLVPVLACLRPGGQAEDRVGNVTRGVL